MIKGTKLTIMNDIFMVGYKLISINQTVIQIVAIKKSKLDVTSYA